MFSNQGSCTSACRYPLPMINKLIWAKFWVCFIENMFSIKPRSLCQVVQGFKLCGTYGIAFLIDLRGLAVK